MKKVAGDLAHGKVTIENKMMEKFEDMFNKYNEYG